MQTLGVPIWQPLCIGVSNKTTAPRALVLHRGGTRDGKALHQAMVDWLKVTNGLDAKKPPGVIKPVSSSISRLSKLFVRHGILEAP